MTVVVNGATVEVVEGTTLDVIVTGLQAAPAGVAAAMNDAVVPRSAWPTTMLRRGDRVEVLVAVQGG